nr:NADH dehydrogenase subunit 3 [Saemundssonia lari]
MFALLIVTTILFLSLVLQTSWAASAEMPKTFECGFDPLCEKRSFQFLHFFHIAVLFVVFDLELAALLPMLVSHPPERVWHTLWSSVGLVLLAGLIWEGEMSSLDWKE